MEDKCDGIGSFAATLAVKCRPFHAFRSARDRDPPAPRTRHRLTVASLPWRRLPDWAAASPRGKPWTYLLIPHRYRCGERRRKDWRGNTRPHHQLKRCRKHLVALTVNVEGSNVLIGTASAIDGDTIGSYGAHSLGGRKTLIEEACGSSPHSWTCSAGP